MLKVGTNVLRLVFAGHWHIQSGKNTVKNRFPLRRIQLKAARPQIRKNISVIRQDDGSVISRGIHLKMIVVAVKKRGGQFAGLTHLFDRSPFRSQPMYPSISFWHSTRFIQ